VKLADGRKYKAEVVGRDAQTDLAVIKIKTDAQLPYVALGDSDVAQSGDWVMAIGNPFGFEHTVTVGVISAKGRVIDDPKAPITKFIQTDASINPGNSGGPLFNLNGEVVGINTMIFGMGTGIGFAIPSNLAKALIPQLISEGKVTRGWLGVQIQRLTKELAESYGLEEGHGALIGNVLPDSPAAKGGLQRGDIVTEFDGKKIDEPFDLQNFVSQTKVGRQVPVKVLRQKKELLLTIPMGKRESEEEVAAGGPSQQQEGAKGDVLGLVVRDQANSKGVVVLRVISDSPSEYQDIREGDLIVEVNDTAVNNAAAYKAAIQNVKKGSLVRLLLGRGTMTIYIAFRV
ncbi:MAG: PDZ domain-containing protein, partial [Deltaproteobacteria bacterium]|nr:PDZ domain-containing protein [Deltaproteobacteria bacterium]